MTLVGLLLPLLESASRCGNWQSCTCCRVWRVFCAGPSVLVLVIYSQKGPLTLSHPGVTRVSDATALGVSGGSRSTGVQRARGARQGKTSDTHRLVVLLILSDVFRQDS